MSGFRFDRVLEFLISIEMLVILLWIGLALFTVSLIVMMQTRLGQSRALTKCVVLSCLAHLLFAGYAFTVRIVSASPPPEEPAIRVTFVEGPEQESSGAEDPVYEEKPWERLRHEWEPEPEAVDPTRHEMEELPEPQRRIRAQPTRLPGEPPLDHLALAEVKQPEPQKPEIAGPSRRSTSGKPAQTIEAPPARRRDPDPLRVPDQPAVGRRAVTGDLPAAPDRASTSGVPLALLEPLVPLPRLEAVPVAPRPADSLAGLTDRVKRPGRSDTERSAASQTDLVASRQEGSQSPQAWRSSTGSASGQPTGIGNDPQAAAGTRTVVPEPSVAGSRPGGDDGRLPDAYRLRIAPDRQRRAEIQGATPQTEAAVKAALQWLARVQLSDGHWDAGDHGGGRELKIDGHNRQRAGVQADTGISGLALLAFLASGHTHREGQYRDTVRRGLQYLLNIQARDGNLSGRATPFARMYCHSMAAFALSEAYGMTDDDVLRRPVQRAVYYTIGAQDPSAGGWRYSPRDAGDTSQCGWQVMALKSADLAGMPMSVRTQNGIIRYLRSASSGRHGGLSSYQPGKPVSRPMSAEALVCWQFLGLPREHPAGNEAGDYLIGELPGEGPQPNYYYWYYATLAMYQLQGEHWQRWNEALRTTLVDSQRKEGPAAGSWDPDSAWGGHGGRIYTTALATLSLEVYYRYLPLYVQAAQGGEDGQ